VTILGRAVTEETPTRDKPSDTSPPLTDAPNAQGSSQPASAESADPLEVAKAEGVRLRDQLLRTAADFDNFRKRTRRELADTEKRVREEFLRELLPVFDNLERATAHAEAAIDVKALADGIGLVVKQFLDTLTKVGVERLKSQGEMFDPAFHEAVQQVESVDHPPGTVVHEVQAGYRLGDRLVRPALVVVAAPPANR
jgi:molecular chaperone GrpE